MHDNRTTRSNDDPTTLPHVTRHDAALFDRTLAALDICRVALNTIARNKTPWWRSRDVADKALADIAALIDRKR